MEKRPIVDYDGSQEELREGDTVPSDTYSQNIDGGSAASIYLADQSIDGGSA